MADHDAGESATEEEEEWRFPLSEFEENGDGDADEAVVTDADEAVVTDADIDGEPAEADATIEAGDPTLEGAFFLLLGVAFALFVVSRLFVA